MSLILNEPIISFEVDGPLLTFKLSDITLPLPIALGLDSFITLKSETSELIVYVLDECPPIL